MNGTMSRRELEEAVRSSDRDTLESVIMSLADMFGAASVARAFGEVGDGISGTHAEAIAERTESALYVDGDALRGMGGTDEYGGPVDPEEYATDMMRQCLRDEFEDEVWELVRKGRNTEACDVVRRIAEGIRRSDSALVIGAPRLAEELVYHLDWCADHGKPLEGFS